MFKTCELGYETYIASFNFKQNLLLSWSQKVAGIEIISFCFGIFILHCLLNVKDVKYVAEDVMFFLNVVFPVELRFDQVVLILSANKTSMFILFKSLFRLSSKIL